MFANKVKSAGSLSVASLALFCGFVATGMTLESTEVVANSGTVPSTYNYHAYCRQSFPGSQFKPMYNSRGMIPSCKLLGGVTRRIDMNDFCRKITGSPGHHTVRNNRGEVTAIHCDVSVARNTIPSTNRVGPTFSNTLQKGQPLNLSRYCERVLKTRSARYFPQNRTWACVARNPQTGRLAYYRVNLQTACHATTGRRNYRFTDINRGFVTCI